MRYPGFVGPTYTLRSTYAAMDRCVNLYPELNELHNQKNGEIGLLVGRPGMTELVDLGPNPIRPGGIYPTSTGSLLVITGKSVYRVDSTWTATYVGDLLSNSGPVSITDNGQQAIIVDGAAGYIVSFVTGAETQITSAGFSIADTVTFQDGYFIINNSGTGQFGLSSLYDGATWDALDFATAEGSPDDLLAVLSNNRQLWLFGSKSIEVWWNTGASDFPFSRIDGAFAEIGCGAAHTTVRLGNSVAWVSDKGYVYLAEGYNPNRISNHAVEIAIQDVGDFSTATAWSYADSGHWFYCLDLPGAASTWVYDMGTGQWHERTFTGTDGVETLQLANSYGWAYNTHVVGSRVDGKLYKFDFDAFTDGGSTITRRRIAPHLSASLKRVFIHRAQLDLQPGVGLDGTGQGTDPYAQLRISKDGGFTWSNWQTASLGKIGEYGNRAIWRRLGQGRDFVFDVKITDPVRVVILGMELDMMPGAS